MQRNGEKGIRTLNSWHDKPLFCQLNYFSVLSYPHYHKKNSIPKKYTTTNYTHTHTIKHNPKPYPKPKQPEGESNP